MSKRSRRLDEGKHRATSSHGQSDQWRSSRLRGVATPFSCLCTLNGVHNFVPRRKPPFITALAAEDRCHLNGLAVIEGRPGYVTVLGESDTPKGWRVGKAVGG
jgi:uncharacterized protein (TIGR03032 family)